MKVSSLTLFTIGLFVESSLAFQPIQPSQQLKRSSATFMSNNEFDFILQEQQDYTNIESTQATTRRNRRAVQLSRNSDSKNEPAIILTSSTTIDATEATASAEDEDIFGLEGVTKVQQLTTQQKDSSFSLSNKLKQMDLQDIVTTLILPSILLFASGRYVYNRVSSRIQESFDTTLDSFAKELIYHDGDWEEMKLCVQEYSQKLLTLPSRTDKMIKAYLQQFVKKITVSPKAISSMSYVFTLFNLNEQQAAKLLVSLCREMGPSKISSAGKLLFLGSRVLQTKEGKQSLAPIQDMIMATYRDEAVAETMVETSQIAMAEAAYRATVKEGGKNQKGLTVGWQVLGLTQETAERIFEEEAKEGFVSYREEMYGGQTRKYDKKGRQIDEKGDLANPEEADDDDDETDTSVSNVYECGECGYTLFVAQGREGKFYGSDFKCPECGAPKKKFQARDDMDD